jgi:F-type H+-transporting ATPase subunit epsilon
MKTLECTILTPTGIIYEGEAREVVIPTEAGEITVLPNHAPLISSLRVGEVRVKNDETLPFAVDAGAVHVMPDSRVMILAYASESAQDIDVERAEAAYQRAAEAMSEESVASVDDKALFESRLKYLNRVKVGKKWQKM